jgi:hypothetical protein
MSRLLAALLALGGLAFAGPPAVAHHSMAAYEFFAATMEGTVVAFKYKNPHCILVLRTRGKNGRAVTWHLLGDAPAMVDRAGFGPNTFRRGDRLKLQIQPLKNGKPGGFWSIRMVIMKNGHEFSGHQCVTARECN